MSIRVKEEEDQPTSVKSEYAGYDPVKDEETEDEDDLLGGKLSIKNEVGDVNVKSDDDDDDDTDDEYCRGKLAYHQRYMRILAVCGINL